MCIYIYLYINPPVLNPSSLDLVNPLFSRDCGQEKMRCSKKRWSTNPLLQLETSPTRHLYSPVLSWCSKKLRYNEWCLNTWPYLRPSDVQIATMQILQLYQYEYHLEIFLATVPYGSSLRALSSSSSSVAAAVAPPTLFRPPPAWEQQRSEDVMMARSDCLESTLLQVFGNLPIWKKNIPTLLVVSPS